MRISKLLLFALGFFLVSNISAQETARQTNFSFPLVHQFDPKEATDDYHAHLQHLEAPNPGGDSYRDFLQRQKEIQRALHPVNRNSVKRNTTTVDDMTLGENLGTNHHSFDVPRLGGTPNDNTVAISNSCMLMSSFNTEVWAYDLSADTNLFNLPNKHPSFAAFSGDDDLFFPFDPKLTYDPNADRFILIFLSGRGPDNSEIIVCFSTTNNPSDPWNVYSITGNPHNNTTWTDYPALTVTESELFITVNLLRENEPWETGFDETIIWQIDLQEGYTGAPDLNTRLWDDINFNGEPLRYLCPVKGGLEPEGPNAYFLGNRPWDLTNDTVFVIEVTGTKDDPNTTINVTQGVSNANYGMPPDAQQADNHLFQTNDARVLAGVLLGDKIQFVGNTINDQTGLAAIYHGFIDDVDGTPVFTGEIISDPVQDFGYANIAYSGVDGTDDETVIVFDHTSPTDFAGFSTINYSDGEYSNLLVVKEGEAVIDRLGAQLERWGDYSGIQRKYNEPGKVWTAGTYGYAGDNNSSWMGEVVTSSYTNTFGENGCSKIPTAVRDLSAETKEAVLYPNPVVDRMTVSFEVESTQHLRFDLYSLDGRHVALLGQGSTKRGKNEFSFSTQPLSAGTYILRVQSDAGVVLLTKKVIKD